MTTKPNCLYCGKQLRPNYDEVCTACGVDVWKHSLIVGASRNAGGRDGACELLQEQILHGNRKKKILKGWGRRNDGYFCSDRHGIWFAEAAADAGYRLVKKA
jgi:hypothetical protein